jgi:hypothetical protein
MEIGSKHSLGLIWCQFFNAQIEGMKIKMYFKWPKLSILIKVLMAKQDV